ncbi:hypothetical protein PGB90_007456 [Kerria lacca]
MDDNDDMIEIVNEERTDDPDKNDDEAEDEVVLEGTISHAEGYQAIMTTLAYMEHEELMTLAEKIMLKR